jgi:Ca2+-binding RTX toxin-like protein
MATFTAARDGFTNLDNTYNGLPVRMWGTTGTITDVSVTLTGLSHSFPDDLDLMLFGPGSRTLVFMSDAGGSFAISNVNLTFSDGATQALPDSGQIASGSYRPGAFTGDTGDTDFSALFPAVTINNAAPNGSATFASVFNGISANSGDWTLAAKDDFAVFPGNLDTFTLTVKTSGNAVVLEDPVFSGEGDDVIIVTSTGAKSGSYTYNGGSTVTFSGVSKITIKGHEGNDTLQGGVGNDTLKGGSGHDVLTGGLGRDVMKGGSGHDDFDFNSVKEARHDVIQDFHRGDDIDLSTIDAKQGGGNQAFHFIGTHAFTRHAGELRFIDKGASCLVQGDVNGDGRADFDILVKVGTLHQGDFLL